MANLKFIFNEEQKNSIRRIITKVPKNEEEVKRIFYKLEDLLGFGNIQVFDGFPDASAYFREKEIYIEFEKNSSNFRQHKHDEKSCDLIICWENDDQSLKVPILELATIVDDWLKARSEAISEYSEIE